MLKIKIKRLRDDAILPTRGSEQAAGYDLYACSDCDLIAVLAGRTNIISTGVAVEIPEGYFGAIFARSGLATKQGLRPANCVGVIDSDYRGEVKVALHNDTSYNQIIDKGDRIAQLVIMPYINVEFEETDDLDETSRGEGGFGSTGMS